LGIGACKVASGWHNVCAWITIGVMAVASDIDPNAPTVRREELRAALAGEASGQRGNSI
jgi:hypothetical protein